MNLKSTSVLSVLALFLFAPVAMVLLAGVPTAAASVTVTVACSPNPDNEGGVTTCRATVSSPAPSGGDSITISGFGSGSTSPSTGVCTISSGGTYCTVSYAPASGTENSYTITATCTSGNCSGGSGTTNLVVVTSTTTAITCLPQQNIVGVSGAESCTVTVTNHDSGYNVKATGAVTFSGTLPSGMPTSCTLAGGTGTSNSCVATWTPASGTEGTYSISASYGGDATHASSSTTTTSASSPHIETPTTTTLSCSPSPGIVGVSESCTATVTNVDSAYNAQAHGTVTFSGTLPSGMPTSCTLAGGTGTSISCSATWTPGSGTEGTGYSISASFGGDSTFITHVASSTSSATSLHIQTSTTTTLSCSPSPGIAGVSESCTATVTNGDSGFTSRATGTVTFSGTLPPGMPTSCTLTSGSGTSNSCSATWTPHSGAPGSYSISASYGGDTYRASSSSSATPLNIGYYLTVSSSYGTTSGAGWYDAGAVASFSVSPTTVSGGGTRYVFSSWSGSYSGPNNPGSVTINGPITETASWTTQYQVTYQATGCVLAVTVPSSEWVNSGGSATGSFPATVSGSGTQCLFVSDNRPSSITGPTTIAGTYQTQYQVTYQATGCVLAVTVPSSEWVNSGGSATGSFPATVSGSGTQCLFVSDNRPATITAPITITGTYQTQYYLTVSSAYGSPTGQGWYNAGATASFGVTTPASGGIGVQYVFSSWSGSYSGSNNPGSVTMNGPITETASWTTQYQVTYAQTGCVLTVTLPATEWVNSGSPATGSFPATVSGSGTQCLFVSDNRPATITAPITITGTYQTQYQVSFSVSPPGSGTTSPSGSNQWENAGLLPISTTASSGYLFWHWTATGPITLASSTSAGTTATISGTGTITADYRAITTVSVSCVPTIFDVGATSTCTATVSGGYSPTGTVAFTQSPEGGIITFPSPATCTLSSDSCSITVTGTEPGILAITATYSGDTNNLGSSGSARLTVAQYAVSTAITSSVSPPVGFCPTTNPTGVSVWIVNSTAKAGTAVMIYVTNLGNLGSGTTGLVTMGYYGIQVVGVTDGTAIVCIDSSQVTSTTQMEYYYGGWYNASQTFLIKGSAIRADIPVSALNGVTTDAPVSALNGVTKIAIGTPIVSGLRSAFMMSVIRNARAPDRRMM